MPAKIKVTREDIVEAAVALTREGSLSALSARTVAARLGCSTQPIFSNFPGMDALLKAVLTRAYEIYAARIYQAMDEGRYPAYKASGMAYIAFAVEEPQLFRLIFMRDRRGEEINDMTDEAETIIMMIMNATGLSRKDAGQLHGDMWIFVHGLAAMYVTGFYLYNEAAVSETLTRVYFSLLEHYQKGSESND